MATKTLPDHVCHTNHATQCYVGTCPACRQPVLWDDPDGPVWTCPADLSDTNPFREPAHEMVTEDLRERFGIYSNCGDDFGFQCYERLPLHGQCYDKGQC